MATSTINLRLLPEIRLWIERMAEKDSVSLTCVALSAFDLLYAAKNGQMNDENSLYW